MARKKRLQCADNTREKIKVSMLLKRLTDHILGTVELSPTQVQAAKILLGKTLPDLSSINLDANISLRPKLIDLSGGKLIKAMEDEPTDPDS